ncbi:hypothetical protein FOVSG1_001906 [Fusarium oxysporum f. sp. vasinfectum]
MREGGGENGWSELADAREKRGDIEQLPRTAPEPLLLSASYLPELPISLSLDNVVRLLADASIRDRTPVTPMNSPPPPGGPL